MTRLRAVAHVHSEWSYDANWELADLARAFRRMRYDVVLMAEHDKGFSEDRWAEYRQACAQHSHSGLLIVPGIEYSDADNVVHVPAWGPLPFLGEGLDTGELLARVAECNGVAVLAHPWRRDAWRSFRKEWTPQLLGVEVWNRKYDGWAPNPRSVQLVADTDLLPFVTLDFHRSRQFFPLAMNLEVKGPATVEAVFASLRARSAEPKAFRLPVRWFTGRGGSVVANGAERLRRPAANAWRRVQERRG